MMTPQLGNPIAVHRGSFRAGGWFWYVGGLLLASGVVIAGRVALASLGLGQLKGTVQDAVMTSAGSLAVAAACLILPWARWRQRVQVFDLGFVWNRLWGTTTVLRADIVDVQVILSVDRARRLNEVVVTLRGGPELTIAGLQDAPAFANGLRYGSPAQAAQDRLPPIAVRKVSETR